MAQKNPTMAVAATKLPKEMLAQVDRLASRRGVTRSTLLRQALDLFLAASDEPMTDAEQQELLRRQVAADANRRLGEIKRRLRMSVSERVIEDRARRHHRARGEATS